VEEFLLLFDSFDTSIVVVIVIRVNKALELVIFAIPEIETKGTTRKKCFHEK